MKALLVDDHPMVLSELQAVAASLGNALQIVLAGSVGAARVALTEHTDLDLVLLDLRSDDVQSLRWLAELRQVKPGLPVVVVSACAGADSGPAPRTGAFGLLDALSGRGSGFVGHGSAVAANRSDPGIDAIDWRFRLTAHASLDRFGLTRRQQQVLALIMEGQSNKSIARQLSLSVDTIKDHVTALMKSLNVSSRTQAVLAVTGRAAPSQPEPAQRPS